MSTATADNGDDEFRSRKQQSMLASQRQKEGDASAPTEENRRGRIGGFFTLGYKEGFQQWVKQLDGRSDYADLV